MDNMPKLALGLSTPWQANAPKVPPNTAILGAAQELHRVLKILWPMKLNYILVAALIVGFAGAAVAEQNQFYATAAPPDGTRSSEPFARMMCCRGTAGNGSGPAAQAPQAPAVM